MMLTIRKNPSLIAGESSVSTTPRTIILDKHKTPLLPIREIISAYNSAPSFEENKMDEKHSYGRG